MACRGGYDDRLVVFFLELAVRIGVFIVFLSGMVMTRRSIRSSLLLHPAFTNKTVSSTNSPTTKITTHCLAKHFPRCCVHGYAQYVLSCRSCTHF